VPLKLSHLTYWPTRILIPLSFSERNEGGGGRVVASRRVLFSSELLNQVAIRIFGHSFNCRGREVPGKDGFAVFRDSSTSANRCLVWTWSWISGRFEVAEPATVQDRKKSTSGRLGDRCSVTSPPASIPLGTLRGTRSRRLPLSQSSDRPVAEPG